jgi:hypothetical protein
MRPSSAGDERGVYAGFGFFKNALPIESRILPDLFLNLWKIGINGLIIHEQILEFHRKLTHTKIGVVRRKAALRPTYFQWRTGRFVFSLSSCNEWKAGFIQIIVS